MSEKYHCVMSLDGNFFFPDGTLYLTICGILDLRNYSNFEGSGLCHISLPPFHLLSLFLFFIFLPHLQYMEVPKLGVQLELQLPAYTTATAMPNPSCICNLHWSLWQHGILNPLREARDRIHILTDTSWVLKPIEPQWELLCWILTSYPWYLPGKICILSSIRDGFSVPPTGK